MNVILLKNVRKTLRQTYVIVVVLLLAIAKLTCCTMPKAITALQHTKCCKKSVTAKIATTATKL